MRLESYHIHKAMRNYSNTVTFVAFLPKSFFSSPEERSEIADNLSENCRRMRQRNPIDRTQSNLVSVPFFHTFSYRTVDGSIFNQRPKIWDKSTTLDKLLIPSFRNSFTDFAAVSNWITDNPDPIRLTYLYIFNSPTDAFFTVAGAHEPDTHAQIFFAYYKNGGWNLLPPREFTSYRARRGANTRRKAYTNLENF